MKFDDMMKGLFEKMQGEPKLSEKPICKLSHEEVATFAELKSRAKAASKGYERAMSKIMSDRDVFWANLQTKYNTHGISGIHYKEEDGSLYEVLD